MAELPEGKTAAVSQAAPHERGEAVLLADDNPRILDLLTRVLESRGYIIIQAADGEAMLSLWMKDRERIRLIIADNDMPKRTGLDSLAQIRRAGGTIPAILITGAVGSQVRDRLDSATIVLGKPVQMPELVKRIRKMLDADRRASGS